MTIRTDHHEIRFRAASASEIDAVSRHSMCRSPQRPYRERKRWWRTCRWPIHL